MAATGKSYSVRQRGALRPTHGGYRQELYSVRQRGALQPAQGILTYRRYMQREFKLKFSVLLKAYDGKCTENSKK